MGFCFVFVCLFVCSFLLFILGVFFLGERVFFWGGFGLYIYIYLFFVCLFICCFFCVFCGDCIFICLSVCFVGWLFFVLKFFSTFIKLYYQLIKTFGNDGNCCSNAGDDGDGSGI